jgi:hypothetical protein
MINLARSTPCSSSITSMQSVSARRPSAQTNAIDAAFETALADSEESDAYRLTAWWYTQDEDEAAACDSSTKD